MGAEPSGCPSDVEQCPLAVPNPAETDFAGVSVACGPADYQGPVELMSVNGPEVRLSLVEAERTSEACAPQLSFSVTPSFWNANQPFTTGEGLVAEFHSAPMALPKSPGSLLVLSTADSAELVLYASYLFPTTERNLSLPGGLQLSTERYCFFVDTCYAENVQLRVFNDQLGIDLIEFQSQGFAHEGRSYQVSLGGAREMDRFVESPSCPPSHRRIGLQFSLLVVRDDAS
jgi:hypothetical protein